MCPICGYGGLLEPPYDEFGCSSFEICSCCGTEFGNDDDLVPHSTLRQQWIDSGMHWWSTTDRPPVGWDAAQQLKDVVIAAGKAAGNQHGGSVTTRSELMTGLEQWITENKTRLALYPVSIIDKLPTAGFSISS